MKYYLSYVAECTPKIKKFNSLIALRLWVADFMLKYRNEREPNPDYWINMYFKGEIIFNTDEVEGEG